MILGVSVLYRRIIYKEGKPARHHNLIHKINDDYGSWQPTADEQGFFDKDNDFISREDALKQALESGQITKHSHKTKLFSEDLW